MSYLAAKLAAALTFFCLGVIFGFLPILWYNFKLANMRIVANVEIMIGVSRC